MHFKTNGVYKAFQGPTRPILVFLYDQRQRVPLKKQCSFCLFSSLARKSTRVNKMGNAACSSGQCVIHELVHKPILKTMATTNVGFIKAHFR